jgi:hypothetical protein
MGKKEGGRGRSKSPSSSCSSKRKHGGNVKAGVRVAKAKGRTNNKKASHLDPRLAKALEAAGGRRSG